MSEEEKKFAIIEIDESKYIIILTSWIKKRKVCMLPSLEPPVIAKNVLKQRDPNSTWMKIKATKIHRFTGIYNNIVYIIIC